MDASSNNLGNEPVNVEIFQSTLDFLSNFNRTLTYAQQFAVQVFIQSYKSQSYASKKMYMLIPLLATDTSKSFIEIQSLINGTVNDLGSDKMKSSYEIDANNGLTSQYSAFADVSPAFTYADGIQFTDLDAYNYHGLVFGLTDPVIDVNSGAYQSDMLAMDAPVWGKTFGFHSIGTSFNTPINGSSYLTAYAKNTVVGINWANNGDGTGTAYHVADKVVDSMTGTVPTLAENVNSKFIGGSSSQFFNAFPIGGLCVGESLTESEFSHLASIMQDLCISLRLE